MTEKQPLLGLKEDAETSRLPGIDHTSTPRSRRTALRLPLALSLITAILLIKLCILLSLLKSSHYFKIYVPRLEKSFLHECSQLLSPEATTYTSRLDKLAAVLSPATSRTATRAVWIAEPGASAEYFIGAFSRQDWWLSERPFLIALSPSGTAHRSESRDSRGNGADIFLLTPEFERLRAQLLPLPATLRSRVQWISWKESESPYDLLHSALGNADTLVLDGQVREFVASGLNAAFGSEAIARGEATKGEVSLIRERKDEREIGLLRCANQMTLHAIRRTRAKMHFGITESQTRTILLREMDQLGLEDSDALVLFGENAALPHGSGTDRKLGRADLALIDAGGKFGGYVADITRTFALPRSNIPRQHLRMWETVRRAQHAAYKHLHAYNVTSPPTCGSMDAAARRVVSSTLGVNGADRAEPVADEDPGQTSQPDYSVFTHRLGHGVGLEGHEQPYLVQGPQGERRIKPGHVFSLEPGMYLPRADLAGGGVGVRLEDCFVVREDKHGRLGGEWLTGPVQAWGDV